MNLDDLHILSYGAKSVKLATMKETQQWIAADFVNFLNYANRYFGFKTARIQLLMAKAIASSEPATLLTCFRGSSKSYLVDLYILWRFHRCWNTRIMILGGTSEIAEKHIRRLVNIIETLPALKYLTFSKRTESGFQLSVARTEADLSLRAAGIFSAIESSRADLIIVDDAELGQNSFSPSLRQKILNRFSEIEAILHPPNRLLDAPPEKKQVVMVGTPMSEFSVYLPPRDPEEPHPLRQASRLQIPCLDRLGRSTFPERFSTEVLHRKRGGMSRPRWYLNMMCDPTLLDKSQRVIDYDALVRWRGPIVEPIMAIDPAGEEGGGDEHALCIGGLQKSDNNVAHIIRLAGKKNLKIDDFFLFAIEEARKHKVEKILIESNINGYTSLLKKMMGEAGSFAVIEPVKSYVQKQARLVEILDPQLNGKRVSFSDVVLNDEDTRQQFGEWTYASLPSNDDRLDALSFVVAYFTQRLSIPDNYRFEVASMS